MDKQKILRNLPSREFWRVNSAVWMLAAVINFTMQYLGSGNLVKASFSIIPIILCFLLTSALRYYWGVSDIYNYRPGRLILALIPQLVLTNTIIVLLGIGSIVAIHGYSGSLLTLLISNFFSLLVVIMLWAAIYFVIIYYNSMRRNEMDKLRLQLSLQNAQLSNLKNQLNPHFLFNALNNIRGLILEDAEMARTMISSVTDILRYSLKTQNEQKIILKQEILFIEEYLKLEHLHMESRLSYSISIDENAVHLLIPPMTIQLLVENAIKHGLSRIPEGGILEIKGRAENGILSINVMNTGGLKQNAGGGHLGVGLTNLRERLNLLYKGKATFSICQDGETVRAEITIPAEDANESTYS